MALDKLKESASLSEAVEFTNNIKNEISTIKTTLANNIVGKNVTASNTESLSSLVGKVSNIAIGKRYANGTCSDFKFFVYNSPYKLNIPINLGFIPSTFILTFSHTSVYGSYGTKYFAFAKTPSFSSQVTSGNDDGKGLITLGVSISNISNSSCTANITMTTPSDYTHAQVRFSNVKWYAYE